MFGDHFYHATMRKSVAVFGTLFNNLKVARKAADGSVLNQVRVPLAYGPKQKFLSRLDQETGFDATMAIKLPRMGFEITGLTLDTTQKMPKRNVISETHASDITKKKTIKHYTSYDIGMSLYIMAKNQDDGLQIVEQILPYFSPEYSVTITPVSGFNYKQYYVTPIDERGNVRTDNVNSTERIATDKPINATIDTPASSTYGFYYDGDGQAPNGYPMVEQPFFPTNNVNNGDYCLRTDYLPNRLFRYDGARWVKVEDAVRLTTTNDDTRKNWKTKFVNASGSTTINGLTVDQRQSLTNALKPKADN